MNTLTESRERLARSLIWTEENDQTRRLCLDDLNDALDRCTSNAERDAVAYQTMCLYTHSPSWTEDRDDA